MRQLSTTAQQPSETLHYSCIKVLMFSGMWPFDKSILSYVKNVIVLVALIIHLTLICYNLYIHRRNYRIVQRSVMHLIGAIVFTPMQFLIRFHPKIRKLLHMALAKRKTDESTFQCQTEMMIYTAQINRALKMEKTLLFAVSLLMMCFLMRPLLKISSAIKDPLSASKLLTTVFPIGHYPGHNIPFHTFISAVELVTVFMCFGRCAAFGVMYLIIHHIIGEYDVLAYRLQNLRINTKTVFGDIAQIVEKQSELSKMMKCINDVFGLLLLYEVCVTTVRLGLSFHNLLTSGMVKGASPYQLIFFLVYSVTLTYVFYGICVTGEHLLEASSNFENSIYLCNWYKESTAVKIPVMICMLHSQRYIHLSGAGLYVFSLANFTKIIKTAVGYVSLLRTIE